MALSSVEELAPGLWGVRGPVVWCYLLADDAGVVAIDTGWGPHGGAIKRWFRRAGRPPSDLKAILLSHGHLDHIGCAAELQRWSRAPVYLHPADREFALGRYRGPWPSSLLAAIEHAGNALWWVRRFQIDHDLAEGMYLPFWGGLRVVHLPGHSAGHVGFYAEQRRLFFSADAILARGRRVFFPSRVFNLDDALARTSVIRLIDFAVDRVYPSHHTGVEHNFLEDIRRYAYARAALRRPTAPAP